MPRKPSKPQAPATALDFSALVVAIQHVHEHSASLAKRAVNLSLTLRNWVIGWYIHEYEQGGADRAAYGESLLERLAERLNCIGLDEISPRYLRLCRRFSICYPEIRRSLTAKSDHALLPEPIWRSLTAKFDETGKASESGLNTRHLLEHLTFTHFEQLISLDNPLKRAFYEIECIRGNWSVRALKRQIASLYFERSGLSLDKEKLSAMAHEAAETAEPKLSIRDPYIFEFLGLKPREAVAESDLEQSLLENLQDFLLELGHGFCLEARQKSILIGDTRGFVDLVFYHRILRCHVLVELKVDEFRHEHIGQLNTYVAWFQENMMREGDNPPIGLLLCTGKDHALVEYALSAMNQRLFVSKYQLELPSKDALQQFLDQKRKEVTGEL
jgi:predicted nuclease of restriction endonuclease-like (RecB) superfamily